MLSPTIYDTQNLLTQSLNEINQIDKYSVTSENILIGKLPKDPDWLASVRSRTAMLGDAGKSWILQKPDIWAPILVQFSNYASSFASVAELQSSKKLTTSEAWISTLKSVLQDQLDQCVQVTTTANDALVKQYNMFKNIQPLLEDSINAGWAELAGEEKEMVKLAAELTSLQDKVESLQDSITSKEITTGTKVVSTTVSTIYNVVTEAGGSFSFMSFAASAYTVGRMYYDIITKTEDIVNTLEEIGKLQLAASAEAQAAAGTKMVLQFVYDIEKNFLSIQNFVPQIKTMWSTELQKLNSVITALESGADPNNYFELLTIPTANKSWQTISSFTSAIPDIKLQEGKPVVLCPGKPISS